MKPIKITVTANEASVLFNEGTELKIADLQKDEQDFAWGYLRGVFDLPEIKTKKGSYAGDIKIDQDIKDWNIGMARLFREAYKNDAMFEIDNPNTVYPEQYLKDIQVQYRLAQNLAVIFEELSNGN